MYDQLESLCKISQQKRDSKALSEMNLVCKWYLQDMEQAGREQEGPGMGRAMSKEDAGQVMPFRDSAVQW